MKRSTCTIITISLVLGWTGAAHAQIPVSPTVIISELQTSNTTASEEFIELYNTTDNDIDFSDKAHDGKDIWKIQFFSSTKVLVPGFNWDPKTSGLTTISLVKSDGSPVVVAAHSYFLISTLGYSPGGVEPDFTYPTGHMSDSGGGVQLVDAMGSSSTAIITSHDHLGWLKPTPSQPLINGLYLTPNPGASLQRQLLTEAFTTSDIISPKESWAAPQDSPTTLDPNNSDLSQPLPNTMVDIVPETQPVLVASSVATAATLSVQPLPIQITELLPNPAAPLSDSRDEYIELFNPNNQTINLNGFSLQTGLTFSYSYSIQNLSIAPQQHLALLSSETSLSLANSGGQARLLSSTGQVISQTEPYTAALAGQAWAMHDGRWQWTTTPTPGQDNIVATPVKNGSSTSTTPTALNSLKIGGTKPISTKAAVKTTTSTKPASTKAVKTSASAKSTKPTKTTAGPKTFDPKPKPAPLHMIALVGVSVVAVLYALYEYRTDLANKFHQLRRNRETRREARAAS